MLTTQPDNFCIVRIPVAGARSVQLIVISKSVRLDQSAQRYDPGNGRPRLVAAIWSLEWRTAKLPFTAYRWLVVPGT